MAISAPHFAALKKLAAAGEFAEGGRLLEIGEANWYGDISIEEITKLAEAMPIGDARLRSLISLLKATVIGNDWASWDAVKGLYHVLFAPAAIVSIDLHGTPNATQWDLNKAEFLSTGWNYDILINHGTAEHIFNIANVFRLMHDACLVGGLMIHESPFTGWVDHGFYTLQPTLFYDLAAANGYDIRLMAIEHIESQLLLPVESREHFHALAKNGKIPNNAMLYVAMRKTADEPFKIPMQGVYAQTVSQQVQQAWRALR